MIFIDYKPVIEYPGSKIVFTSKAESEQSIVYMDKDDVPLLSSLVWLQIKNVDYNPAAKDENGDDLNNRNIDGVTNPDTNYPLDHATNPYWLFQRWMWVDSLVAEEVPVNLQRDENGNPVYLPDGRSDLLDWYDRPHLVKVILYEHKFALTRQASLDHVNILHRLSYILNLYNELAPIRFFNELDWPGIATFLSVQRAKLDYNIQYEDPDNPGNFLPTEYPPGYPHHCLWKHLTLCECLEDLLDNFQSRVLERTSQYSQPVKELYLDPDPNIGGVDNVNPGQTLTDLVWRKRRHITYRDDIQYQQIEWPVHTQESLSDETNALPYFPRFDAYFNNMGSGYKANYHPITAAVSQPVGAHNSTLNFFCHLFPHAENYMPSTFTEMELYLKSAYVNVETYYSFRTYNLPYDFYDTGEWERITLTWEKASYGYLVEHFPRQPHKPITPEKFELHAVIQARVVSNNQQFGTGGTEKVMLVEELVDLSNNLVFDGQYLLPIDANGVKPRGIITARIVSNNIVLEGFHYNRDNLPPEDPTEKIPILWSGDQVDSIFHTIVGWDFAISDEDLELADPNTPDKVFNYTFDRYELTDAFPFETVEWKAKTNLPGTSYNLETPTTKNQAILFFRMSGADYDENLQNVIDYLNLNQYFSELTYRDEFVATVAAYWLRYYEQIHFTIGMSHDVTKLDIYFAETRHDRYNARGGVHPDLDPGAFLGPGLVPATTLPYTWTGDPDFAHAVADYSIVQTPYGMPHSIFMYKFLLYRKYYKYFRSFDTQVYLATSPGP